MQTVVGRASIQEVGKCQEQVSQELSLHRFLLWHLVLRG